MTVRRLVRAALAGASLATLSAFAPALALPGACAWTQVKSPNISQTGDNTFAAVAGRATSDVWAVGQYIPDARPNVTQTFVAHYNGKAWTYVATPNQGRQANALHQVTVEPGGRAWAVGYFIDDQTFVSHSLILAWDGAAWSIVPHPADPGVAAVFFGVKARSATDVWAVGEYENPIDSFHTLIEHFDGHAWRIDTSPDPGETGNILYGVAARGDGLWAVGERAGRESPDPALILHRGGDGWTVIDPPPSHGDATTRLYRVAADGLGVLHAAGEAEDDPRNTYALAEIGVRDDVRTRKVAFVPPGPNHFYGVGAAADGVSWAVGSTFDRASGRQSTLIERADPGGSYVAEASPNPSRSGDSLLADMAAIGSDLWAVGAYDGPNAQRSLILHSCHVGAPAAAVAP